MAGEPDPPALPVPPDQRRLVALLLILSATTGLIDAVSVLGLGKVFTANMTGNVVLLGFALAGVPGFSWRLYVVALLAFAAGAGLAGRIAKAEGDADRRRWLLTVATVEAGLLGAAALCSVLAQRGLPADAAVLMMIALTAAAMGGRNATVRQLKIPDLTTTVLTLTVTGIAADSPIAGGGSPNLARRVMAILAILAGATIGALLLAWQGLALPLLCAAAIIVAATFALVPRRA